jgi:RNA polymerase sigma-70 factor (ECF subfamily)
MGPLRWKDDRGHMKSATQEEFLAATLPALDLVYNLARRLVLNRADVEDLVQETYLRAFDAWARHRRPRRVEPWIATICLNLGRSWATRASARREYPRPDVSDLEPGEGPELTGGPSVEDEVIREMRRSEVHRALWELPSEQRAAISLMDLNGFTASEVARITGAPRGTVLARVHRGRKRLASILEKEHIDEEA